MSQFLSLFEFTDIARAYFGTTNAVDVLKTLVPSGQNTRRRFLGRSFFMVGSGQTATAIYQQHKKLERPENVRESFQMSQSPNISSATGRVWQEERKILASHIRKGHMPIDEDELYALVTSEIDKIFQENKIHDFRRQLSIASMRIVAKVFFSYSMPEPEAANLSSVTGQGFENNVKFGSLVREFMHVSPDVFLPFSRSAAAMDAIKETIHNILGQRQTSNQPPDYFASLIQKSGYDQQKTDENFNKLASSAKIVLVAGHAALTAQLFAAFRNLARYPESIDKIIQDEEQWGRSVNAKPQLGRDVSEAKKFLLESLRHDSPAFMITKRVSTYIDIESDVITPNDLIIFSVPSIHSDPQSFKNPDDFNADNFSQRAIEQRPKGAFMPFSHGGHGCPLRKASLDIGVIAISYVASRYALEIDPQSPSDFFAKSINNPPRGTVVNVSLRNEMR